MCIGRPFFVRNSPGTACKHAVTQPCGRTTIAAPGKREEATMKLLAKFNLVYLLVMSLGIALSGYIARNLLQGNAQQEVVESARMLMEKALAVRAYTNTQIKPLLASQMATE